MNIFISYSWEDKKSVEIIDKSFLDRGLVLIRDERSLTYTENISNFMESIRTHDYFIIVLSRGYFKSINCMKELMFAMKEKEFQHKVLPVVLDEDFGSIEYLREIILYWMQEDKINKKALEGLDIIDTIEISKKLREIAKIKIAISDVIKIFSNMLYVSYEKERAQNFETIFKKIQISLKEDGANLFEKNELKEADKVILDNATLNHLKDYITGDTNKVKYMSGSNLVDFFNEFGREDIYGQGFPSRWIYTLDCLNELNGTSEMKKIIEKIIDKRNFFGSKYNHEMVLSELNELLEFDGYVIKKIGRTFKVFELID